MDIDPADVQDLDELERGYPRLTLAHLIDAASACLSVVDKEEAGYAPRDPAFKAAREEILKRAKARKPSSAISWRISVEVSLASSESRSPSERSSGRGFGYGPA